MAAEYRGRALRRAKSLGANCDDEGIVPQSLRNIGAGRLAAISRRSSHPGPRNAQGTHARRKIASAQAGPPWRPPRGSSRARIRGQSAWHSPCFGTRHERPQPLRFYGYVDRPYEAVRNLLRSRAGEVLQRATNTASERARGLIARLHLEAAGFEVGVDVCVDVRREARGSRRRGASADHPSRHLLEGRGKGRAISLDVRRHGAFADDLRRDARGVRRDVSSAPRGRREGVRCSGRAPHRRGDRASLRQRRDRRDPARDAQEPLRISTARAMLMPDDEESSMFPLPRGTARRSMSA